tara:strand:- start:623968 stop:625449 length:1482 start_codon:yes stop_codon:yes gene_type:complete
MPISGPVVHRQLMDSFKQGQARLEQVRGQTSDTHELREELDDSRGDALVRLAEYYLPELTREAISNTWTEVRNGVSQVLLRKEDHRRHLHETLSDVNSRRGAADESLVTITRQLDEAVGDQQQVAKQVETQLQNDKDFVTLADRAAVAEAALERAEANLAEIEQDSTHKLPGFQQSALFQYLYDRGFGTPQYTKRGFTRRMDRWLAKYIDYRKARESYEFLRKTPEQMRTIIAEDRTALDTVMDELERKRDTIAEQLGLPEKVKISTELLEQRDEMLVKLDELGKETQHVEHELSELEQTRGPYYREAIQLFREMLDRVDSRDLEQRARATREMTDDQIVARLQGVEAEIDQLDDAAQHRRSQIDQMQRMLDALGRLIQRFRTAGYDSSRAQFVGSLDVVEGLRRAQSEHEVEDLWQTIRQAHSWGPTTMDKITQVATHPMTQVLINAMAHAAAGAMSDHARRAGHRRGRRYPRWKNNRGGWFSDSSSDVFRF